MRSTRRMQTEAGGASDRLCRSEGLTDLGLVQGWVVADLDVLAQMNIPEGEIACEIPDRLVPFFQET